MTPVPHVHEEGSRRHVHSCALYEKSFASVAAVWCSEPFCEDNFATIKELYALGFDAAQLCPIPGLRAALSPDTTEQNDG